MQLIEQVYKEDCWGAWQVLTGKAGIVLIEIKAKDFYNRKGEK